MGCLAGSFGRVCDSWSQSHEFKPRVGGGAYLKYEKKKLHTCTKNKRL